jgi:MSHA biogenesis protein MshL
MAMLCSLTVAAQSDNAPRFDIDVVDAPARSFFQGLVNGTDDNIMVHPELTGRITLSLKHVTVEQALSATRELYGYDFRHTDAGYVVLPANIQTRLFQLDYLDLQRHGVSKTHVSSGQITQGGNKQYGNSAGGGETASSEDKDGKPSGDSGTTVLTRADSDFWSGIEADLKLIVGVQPGRSVVMNRQSGIIMVRAMPDELRDVGDYLQKTTHTVTRQVVLEAKIVEVELSDTYQAGINWAAIANGASGHYLFGQAAPAGGFDANPFTPPGNQITVAPGNPLNGFVNGALGGAFTLAADFSDFNAFIELLGIQGRTHVLSSPRVATLNNQKAIIKAGSDEFFVTKISSTTTTGTAISTSREIELTPFFSGVALDVTPQISDEGEVTLHVHPTISEVTDQKKTLTVAGSTDTLPLALSQIRESDSVVKARSGQLIVIGGLMRESRKDQDYKTPLLGDIPLLGKLFRSERKQSKTVELVILLRPLVVGDKDWEALVREPTERMGKLQENGASR